MFLKKNVSDKEIVDTGMAATLVLLIIGVVTDDDSFMAYAAFALVVNMTFFRLYTYVAKFLLSLSHCLGLVVSTFVLSLVYCMLVVPIALVHRFFGHDPMRLRDWKRGNDSVFVERNFSYGGKDLEHPF